MADRRPERVNGLKPPSSPPRGRRLVKPLLKLPPAGRGPGWADENLASKSAVLLESVAQGLFGEIIASAFQKIAYDRTERRRNKTERRVPAVKACIFISPAGGSIAAGRILILAALLTLALLWAVSR